ncbi:imelysin family protein [Chitinimonas sp. DQS-5]|uniref:Imelysin family protein n=1 Tax=Parachitinimonas caeni TaxID=3031301 RepID=A0ABT7DZ62_9NEIS|nr:imelysin family protein [Parachitinimonas caeni]
MYTPSAFAVEQSAVLDQYGAIVHANYSDTLAAAKLMQQAIKSFVAEPSEKSLADARQAWLAAREFYGQTEAFRFYGGPIDDDKGPEGRINAWPLDEAYIDYVKGKAKAGIINNKKATIDRAKLVALNEKGGEENISTGWHAIEFLLWGQDLNPNGPGNRAFTDFVDGKQTNADRRRKYLLEVTDQLVEDLNGLTQAWAPGAGTYRTRFSKDSDALRKMLTGLGVLTRGEMAGERMEVAMDSQNQEDEQSCFSDNTHRDLVNDAIGIRNVWLGQYKKADGSVLSGPSLRDLVADKDAALAERVSSDIQASVAAIEAIQAPFDREIVGKKDAPGRKRVQAGIDALKKQAQGLAEAAKLLGIKNLAMKAKD